VVRTRNVETTRDILAFMARATQWYRGSSFFEWSGSPSPWVIQLQDFAEGETLMRTRLEMQVMGYTALDDSNYPVCWEGAQVVAALLWDQAEGGDPEAPPGYFDTALFPWIWVQQVNFQSDIRVTDPVAMTDYTIYRNTALSESIDCHSMRATSPGNSSALFFVIDSQTVDPVWADSFNLSSIRITWSVMSKLPA
jgi:hypothetical protein